MSGAGAPPPPPSAGKRTYVSNGRMLDSPPISYRLQQSATSVYNFLGLYVTSLLSLDPYVAASNSRFNTQQRSRPTAAQGYSGAGGQRLGSDSGRGSSGWGSWFGGSGGNGGNTRGGGGGSGTGQGGRRMGTVDDVRGPECGSCG